MCPISHAWLAACVWPYTVLLPCSTHRASWQSPAGVVTSYVRRRLVAGRSRCRTGVGGPRVNGLVGWLVGEARGKTCGGKWSAFEHALGVYLHKYLVCQPVLSCNTCSDPSNSGSRPVGARAQILPSIVRSHISCSSGRSQQHPPPGSGPGPVICQECTNMSYQEGQCRNAVAAVPPAAPTVSLATIDSSHLSKMSTCVLNTQMYGPTCTAHAYGTAVHHDAVQGKLHPASTPILPSHPPAHHTPCTVVPLS